MTDKDVADWFDSHKESYRVGEKRKIKYLLVDIEQIAHEDDRAAVGHRALLPRNEAQFTTPEQVRASHILLKTEGKDEAAVQREGRSAA